MILVLAYLKIKILLAKHKCPNSSKGALMIHKYKIRMTIILLLFIATRISAGGNEGGDTTKTCRGDTSEFSQN